tara:strand:+ start:283 stop:429 length:147 start_codon:yes stop_codon:yes gene_type:complete
VVVAVAQVVLVPTPSQIMVVPVDLEFKYWVLQDHLLLHQVGEILDHHL